MDAELAAPVGGARGRWAARVTVTAAVTESSQRAGGPGRRRAGGQSLSAVGGQVASERRAWALGEQAGRTAAPQGVLFCAVRRAEPRPGAAAICAASGALRQYHGALRAERCAGERCAASGALRAVR